MSATSSTEKGKANRRRRDLLIFGIWALGLLLVYAVGRRSFWRWDLTAEKRYSISPQTRDLLKSIKEPILFDVYLEGEFPAGFAVLQRETLRMLQEFRAYNDNIRFRFIDPSKAESDQEREELYAQLQSKGLNPYTLEINQKGSRSSVRVFPGALVRKGDVELALPLLSNQLGRSAEEQINSSIAQLEFSLANVLRKLRAEARPKIAFIEGHGELGPRFLADLGRSLSEFYTVDRFDLRALLADTAAGASIAEQQRRLNVYDALLIAKPKRGFTDLDKYLIDQFAMKGGAILWLIDGVEAEMDSLSERSEFLSIPLDERLKLRDLLFKYGARVNSDLVADSRSAAVNDSRELRPWPYFPMILPEKGHPISKNLNALKLEFASTVDTVSAPGIKKTLLLSSSPYAQAFSAPHVVSLEKLYRDPRSFGWQSGPYALGWLLEGEFESFYALRVKPKDLDGSVLQPISRSKPTRMMVVGDGDLAKNQLNLINPNAPKGVPLPLGYDQFTGAQYGNKEFLLNAFDYLLGASDLMNLRSRELRIRILDSPRIESQKLRWQLLNSALPLFGVLLFMVVFGRIRKLKNQRILS